MASPSITEAVILCTGASLHKDINQVVSETAHIVTMFLLPKVTETEIINTDAFTGKITQIDSKYIYIQGAVTDSIMLELLMSKTDIKGSTIIVDDAAKLFITEKTYEKLLVKQGAIMVRESINLLALSINPVSVLGFSFDSREFIDKLRSKINLPVINPKNEGMSCH
jgi:hypothetical protein